MSTQLNSGSRRVRPGVRWLAIVSVIVLAPIAVHAAWDYIEIRRLVREIEAIKAKGEPVNQAQAGRGYERLSDDEKKASAYYLAAAALGSGGSMMREGRDALQPWQEWLEGATQAAPDRDAIARELGAIVDLHAEMLRLADAASIYPFDGFSPGTEYNYRAAQLGKVSWLMAVRTLHFSFANRGDEATESALRALRMRRALRDVPWFWIGGHQGASVLSLSAPSPESLERLQAALEAEEAAFSLEANLAQERAVHIDAVWRRYYGIDPDSPHVRSLPMRSFAEMLWRPWFTHRFVSTLQKWADLMDAARKPWPEKSKAVAAIVEKYPSDDRPARFPFFAPKGLMNAAFWHSGIAQGRTLSMFVTDRCTRVAVALERFRRDNNGALPRSLDQLVPKYLNEVPMDPAGGGPLH